MRKKSINLLYACILSSITISLGAQEDLNEALGSRLLDLAYEKYLQDDIPAAHLVAERILDFAPTSSDAHYLFVLPWQDVQSRTREVQQHLQRAVDADSWHYFSSDMAHLILARIFFRTQQWTELWDILDRHEGYFADLWHFQIEALLEEGRQDEAAEARIRAFSLHPRDPRFAYPWTVKPDLLHAAAIEDILGYSGMDEEYLKLLMTIIPRIQNADWQLLLLRRYFSLDGRSPFMAVIASAYPALAEFSQQLLEWNALENKYLVDYALANKDTYPQAYRQLSIAFSQFTGTTGYDSNFDGYDEQTFVVKRGRVYEWQVDENQDGMFEFSLSFDPLPSSLRMPGTTRERIFFYDDYPQLAVAHLKSKEGDEYFYFQTPGPIFPLLRNPVMEYNPSILLDFSYDMPDLLSTEDIITHSVVRIRQEGRHSLFFRGAFPWLEAVDTNADGNLDELGFLDRGVPILRVSDADYDGRFEVLERISEGRTEEILIDVDGDYFVDFSLYPQLNQQLWNFAPSSREDIREDIRQMRAALQYAQQMREQLEHAP